MVKVCAILACLMLAACHLEPPATYVEQDWSNTMARLSITGVYPITEDLTPGDVLLDVEPDEGMDPQPHIQRLGSLGMEPIYNALLAHERQRLPLDNAKSATAAAAAPATVQEVKEGKTAIGPSSRVEPERHVVDADDFQTAAGRPPRFRRIAIPGTTAIRISDFDFSGAGPFGTVALALGLSSRNSSGVLVRLTDMEMIGFDSLEALELLRMQRLDWLRRNRLTAATLLGLAAGSSPALALRICRGEPPLSGDRSTLRLVNRVLYAHGIEYEYTRDSAFAGHLAAEISSSLVGRALVPAAKSDPAAASPTPADASGSLQSQLAAQNARVQSLAPGLAAASPSSPGGTVSLGIGTFGNAALKEHFARPMAVGFVSLANYTVRGSLILIPDEQSADEQLLAARQFCHEILPIEAELALYGNDDTALSPVELLICSNTNNFRRLEPSTKTSERCGRPDAVREIAKHQNMNEAGKTMSPNLHRGHAVSIY